MKGPDCTRTQAGSVAFHVLIDLHLIPIITDQTLVSGANPEIPPMILQDHFYDIGGEAVVGRHVGEGDLLRPERRGRSTQSKQQQAHEEEAAVHRFTSWRRQRVALGQRVPTL